MLRLPSRLAFLGTVVCVMTVLLVLTAGLVWAAPLTVSFDSTIGPPPATAGFDISFVKNDIHAYILADRSNPSTGGGQVDLFDAAARTFTGGIGSGGFVGTFSGTPPCGHPRGCNGPNGVLIDSSNRVWAADGPAKDCSTAACQCSPTDTDPTSMVKAYTYTLPPNFTSTRVACLHTGGMFRADEMAFDPRDDLLLVANDFDGFLSLIKTSGTPAIVDQFFYADNDVGKPASARGLATAGGGIEQPVWNPQQGFFYLAIPQNDAGTTVGRVDVFNPKPGKLVFLRSIDVPHCDGGPSGLAINADRELVGACGNGAALIDANSGRVSIIGSATTTGGADEIWFDPGSNAWYLSHGAGGLLPVVSAGPDHTVTDVTHAGCCGHSVAAFTASNSESFIFNPNSTGTGISVFKATH